MKDIYLEYHDANKNSHKFYSVMRLSDIKYRLHWGRIGTRGQYRQVARQQARLKIDEKIGKGYIEYNRPIFTKDMEVEEKIKKQKSTFDFLAELQKI